MGWATNIISELRNGKTVVCFPRGNSMVGVINSGDRCKIAPYREQFLKKHSIVLCTVKGNQYLHKIKSIKCIKGENRYLISNSAGKENGWMDRKL